MAIESTLKIEREIEGQNEGQTEGGGRGGGGGGGGGHVYYYTDTPGLETFEINFQEYAKYTKLTTLLIVTRKGGENIRQG